MGDLQGVPTWGFTGRQQQATLTASCLEPLRHHHKSARRRWDTHTTVILKGDRRLAALELFTTDFFPTFDVSGRWHPCCVWNIIIYLVPVTSTISAEVLLTLS